MSTTSRSIRANKQPELMARLILDNPPECPPWCTLDEHPIHGVESALEDLNWTHLGKMPVPGGITGHRVTFESAQFLYDPPRIDQTMLGLVYESERFPDLNHVVISDLTPEQMAALGRALLAAAELAGGDE